MHNQYSILIETKESLESRRLEICLCLFQICTLIRLKKNTVMALFTLFGH